MYDVVIIGAGPAGLTAGIYTARAGLKTMIMEAAMVGGNAAITDLIENYPGFPEGINGSELMLRFMEQAEQYGVDIRYEEVIGLQKEKQQCKIISSQGEYFARAVIIATGAKRRELNVEGESAYLGKGVSYCATCDGAFFQGSPVAVVGGGDTAVKEALYLADIAAKVYLIHRREGFRAHKALLDKMLADTRIELKLNRVVKSIAGDSQTMQKVIIQDVKSGEVENLEVQGVFVSIGLVPKADFIRGFIDSDEGYIKTDEKLMSSVEGIFAAGDIRAKKVRQVATAVGDGASAGVAVTEYLKE